MRSHKQNGGTSNAAYSRLGISTSIAMLFALTGLSSHLVTGSGMVVTVQDTEGPTIVDPPSESTVPPVDPSTGDNKPKEPLSDTLKKEEGVIEPPRGIDPEIKKPIPPDFKAPMPVIPPPGEPGGNPDVQPK